MRFIPRAACVLRPEGRLALLANLQMPIEHVVIPLVIRSDLTRSWLANDQARIVASYRLVRFGLRLIPMAPVAGNLWVRVDGTARQYRLAGFSQR